MGVIVRMRVVSARDRAECMLFHYVFIRSCVTGRISYLLTPCFTCRMFFFDHYIIVVGLRAKESLLILSYAFPAFLCGPEGRPIPPSPPPQTRRCSHPLESSRPPRLRRQSKDVTRDFGRHRRPADS